MITDRVASSLASSRIKDRKVLIREAASGIADSIEDPDLSLEIPSPQKILHQLMPALDF